MKLWPGKPFPLGASYDGAGTNFAIFSEAAQHVELDDSVIYEITSPRRA